MRPVVLLGGLALPDVFEWRCAGFKEWRRAEMYHRHTPAERLDP